jgi:hypothetical protein
MKILSRHYQNANLDHLDIANFTRILNLHWRPTVYDATPQEEVGKRDAHLLVHFSQAELLLIKNAAPPGAKLSPFVRDTILSSLRGPDFWKNFWVSLITAPRDLTEDQARDAYPKMVLGKE